MNRANRPRVKIYFANSVGFFDPEYLADKIKILSSHILAKNKNLDLEIFEPFKHNKNAAGEMLTPSEIYDTNIKQLTDCDYVVVFSDGAGSDVDSGVAFEIGYAKALGKRIFVARQDIRSYEFGLGMNLMLEIACDINIKNFVDFSEFIANFIQQIEI